MAASRENPVSKLRDAARDGMLEEVRLLVGKAGDAACAADWAGWHAIYAAVVGGHEDVVDFLVVEARAMDIDLLALENGSWETPLHVAAQSGKLSMVQKLCALGSDVENENDLGETPADLAREKGFYEVSDFLDVRLAEQVKARAAELAAEKAASLPPVQEEKAEPAVSQKMVLKLKDAARNGDIGEVKRLVLSEGIPITAADRFGTQAVHEAAGWGQEAVLDFLVSEGRRQGLNLLEVENRCGMRPLHIAAGSGRVAMVKKLIAMGADVEAENEFNETPGEHAEWCASRTNLTTPSSNAKRHEVTEILRTLVAEKRLARNRDFLAAVIADDENEANRLLNARADVDYANGEGFSAMHFAAIHGNINMMKLLSLRGQKIDIRTKSGLRPAHLAAMMDNAETLQFLRGMIADRKAGFAEVRDDEGNTPLHVAAMFGSMKALEILVKGWSDVEATNAAGETPLAVARRTGHSGFVEVLRKKVEKERRYAAERAARNAELDREAEERKKGKPPALVPFVKA